MLVSNFFSCISEVSYTTLWLDRCVVLRKLSGFANRLSMHTIALLAHYQTGAIRWYGVKQCGITKAEYLAEAEKIVFQTV